CPLSVVNSIVSTIAELLFLPPVWRTCAEITAPRVCWPPEVMRAPRTRSRTPLRRISRTIKPMRREPVRTWSGRCRYPRGSFQSTARSSPGHVEPRAAVRRAGCAPPRRRLGLRGRRAGCCSAAGGADGVALPVVDHPALDGMAVTMTIPVLRSGRLSKERAPIPSGQQHLVCLESPVRPQSPCACDICRELRWFRSGNSALWSDAASTWPLRRSGVHFRPARQEAVRSGGHPGREVTPVGSSRDQEVTGQGHPVGSGAPAAS